ncbi:MAG: methyltransferase [Bacilli bacterium]|nr:methyltransferase [Bacilli bacterium]
MAQYFDNVEQLGHQDITIEFTLLGENYSFKSDLGVFSKRGLDDGTKLLLETIANLSLGNKILDLGCGAGPIGLILAHLDSSRFITLCDVNRRALGLAKENANILGVSNQVEIVESDVYLNINSIYDTIISNPPIRAGKRVTYRIYDEAGEHLTKDGSLIIVIRKAQGALSVKEHLSSIFNKVEVLSKKKGYLVIKASEKRS